MNPWAFAVKLFASDLSTEERMVLWKLLGRRGWHFGLLLFVLWSSGFLAGVGLPGFARAGDINTQLAAMKVEQVAVRIDLNQRRIQDLPNLIMNATKEWCVATGDARPLRWDIVRRLREEYLTLTRFAFDALKCEDLK